MKNESTSFDGSYILWHKIWLSSGSESEDKDGVFSKLSHSNLITLVQDFMGLCQEKFRHMKRLKNQFDLLKDELKYS